jgi:hypothetical protein
MPDLNLQKRTWSLRVGLLSWSWHPYDLVLEKPEGCANIAVCRGQLYLLAGKNAGSYGTGPVFE